MSRGEVQGTICLRGGGRFQQENVLNRRNIENNVGKATGDCLEVIARAESSRYEPYMTFFHWEDELEALRVATSPDDAVNAAQAVLHGISAGDP